MLNKLELTRARYVYAFAARAHAIGAPTSRLLRQARLGSAVLEDPERLVARAHLYRFIALAANSESEHLGMDAAMVPLDTLGQFGRSLTRARTLRHALVRFCSGAAQEGTARFYFHSKGEDTWFGRNRIPGSADEVAQVEQYLVVLMCNTITSALGPTWKPKKIRLQASAPSPLARWSRLAECDVVYGCAEPAIHISTALLGAGFWYGSRRARGLEALEATHAIRQWLKSTVRHDAPTVEALADGMGLTARTLQRKLAAQSTSFSKELDLARFDIALETMRDEPTVRLTDLAYDLGYANPAHFTRAFKRLTGVAPSRFLHQRDQIGEMLG